MAQFQQMKTTPLGRPFDDMRKETFSKGSAFTNTIFWNTGEENFFGDTRTALVYRGIHVAIWGMAVVFCSIVTFCAEGHMGKIDAGSGSGSGEYTGTTEPTRVLGILGGVSFIVGVLALVAAGLWVEDYKTMPVYHSVVQLLTMFGTVTTVYIFAQASENISTAYYMISIVAVLFAGYAQMLLHSVAVTMEVRALSRVMIASIAISFQLIVAVAINEDEFTEKKMSDTVKALAWVAPSMALVSYILLAMSGKMMDKGNGTGIKNAPFLNAFVLLTAASSALLGTYMQGHRPASNAYTSFGESGTNSFLSAAVVLQYIVFAVYVTE